jgi:hypothetical protein
VRELHRDGPARRQKDLHARDEIVQGGHVREDVVAEQKVGAASFRDQAAGGPEEPATVRIALSAATFATFLAAPRRGGDNAPSS